MFHSQSLVSRKGPLGVIWLAAYFLKKLKKAQVTDTDISYSVDKILQNELDVVTYRVLAYLLLGVVRIYSKKVDYLFDDCHEVLTKINNFVVNNKNKTPMETLHAPSFSITLPHSFELDAFDLEILEDFSGGNVVPREDIMLKDGAWKNEGMWQYSLDKYRCEGFAACQGSCSADYSSSEDVFSHVMNIAKEVRVSCEQGNSEASTENIRGHQTGGEYMEGSEMLHSENQMQGEANNLRDVMFFPEECISPDAVYVVEEEPLSSAELFGWDHQNDEETDMAEEEPPEVVRPVGEERHMDIDIFCGAVEEPPEVVRPVGEDHYTGPEQMKFLNLTSSVNGKCQVNTEGDPLSITPEVTSRLRFPNTSEATAPEFMLIPTPAIKEGAQILREKKCLLDDMVLLPNSFMRQCIEDSRDLISKRKKVPHTALTAWRAKRMSSLSQCFLEPLIPCSSSELRSLFSERRLKVPESAEIVEPPEELDIESPVVDRTLEKPEVALETPVQQSTSVTSFGSPVSHKHYNSDRARPADSFESFEEERSPCEDQEVDLSLLNENDSSEGGDQQLHGLSDRTRMVASYLENTFLKQKKTKEEEVVNLSEVLNGKTKKESARFFYEILVLKSKGYVDVKQDTWYGDILVRKSDEACGADVPKTIQ